MKEKFEKILKEEFPLVFKRSIPIEHDSGWFLLIYNICSKLERMIQDMPERERENFYATQIKEKFGTLRFYMSQETYEMTQQLGLAEKESSKICEICGRTGRIRSLSWLQTLCDEHFAEIEEKKEHLL